MTSVVAIGRRMKIAERFMGARLPAPAAHDHARARREAELAVGDHGLARLEARGDDRGHVVGALHRDRPRGSPVESGLST